MAQQHGDTLHSKAAMHVLHCVLDEPCKVTLQRMCPVPFFGLKYLLLHSSCAESPSRVHFCPPVGRYCTNQNVTQRPARCEQVLAWWVLPDAMQGKRGAAWASHIYTALLGVRCLSTMCETHWGWGSKICCETISLHGLDEQQMRNKEATGSCDMWQCEYILKSSPAFPCLGNVHSPAGEAGTDCFMSEGQAVRGTPYVVGMSLYWVLISWCDVHISMNTDMSLP